MEAQTHIQTVGCQDRCQARPATKLAWQTPQNQQSLNTHQKNNVISFLDTPIPDTRFQNSVYITLLGMGKHETFNKVLLPFIKSSQKYSITLGPPKAIASPFLSRFDYFFVSQTEDQDNGTFVCTLTKSGRREPIQLLCEASVSVSLTLWAATEGIIKITRDEAGLLPMNSELFELLFISYCFQTNGYNEQIKSIYTALTLTVTELKANGELDLPVAIEPLYLEVDGAGSIDGTYMSIGGAGDDGENLDDLEEAAREFATSPEYESDGRILTDTVSDLRAKIQHYTEIKSDCFETKKGSYLKQFEAHLKKMEGLTRENKSVLYANFSQKLTSLGEKFLATRLSREDLSLEDAALKESFNTSIDRESAHDLTIFFNTAKQENENAILRKKLEALAKTTKSAAESAAESAAQLQSLKSQIEAESAAEFQALKAQMEDESAAKLQAMQQELEASKAESAAESAAEFQALKAQFNTILIAATPVAEN